MQDPLFGRQSTAGRVLSYNAKGIRNCFLMPFCKLTYPNLAGTTGFEPAISTLTGSHPRPLDDVPR